MNRNEFNCLILAAGFGTRLGKMGEEKPKGLFRIGETTLVGKVIQPVLKCDSIKQTAIVTNGRFNEPYSQWIVENNLIEKVALLNNGVDIPEDRKGAIGDLAYSLEELNWWGDDLLVAPSDTHFNFQIEDLLRYFSSGDYGLLNVVREVDREAIRGRLGCAVVRGDSMVGFIEKPQENPPSSLASIPFYVYRRDTLSLITKYLEEGGNLDAPGSIISYIINKGIKVGVYRTNKLTIDVGTPADVEELEKL